MIICSSRRTGSVHPRLRGPSIPCLAAGLLMLAGAATAGEVSIDEGEGGRLETYVSSDTNPAVSFGLFGCGADANEYGFELLVFVEDGASVSPFLAKMRETGFSPLQAEVCVGSSCQTPDWTISDYFGAYSGRILVSKETAEQSAGLEFRPGAGEPIRTTFDIKDTFAKICSQ